MATGDNSNPVRFGYGQSAVDPRNLYLKVFGGEVLAAFDLAVMFKNFVEVRSGVRGVKSISFPKTWKATSEYHTPGTELLGTDIDTTEIVITLDDILVSHVAIADLDEMLSHFEVRSKFSAAMGQELAKVDDKNVARQIILASRTAADGPFPAGNTVTDSTLVNTGAIDGSAWIDAIRYANELLFAKDVPESLPRYFATNLAVFNAMKYATDSNGKRILLDTDLGGPQAGGIPGRIHTLNVDGVQVMVSRNLPTTNESADATVYSKYRADFSTTTAMLWTPMAVASARVMEIGFETARDVRRLEDFMLAKMFVGNGTLRPECAVEFKTS